MFCDGYCSGCGEFEGCRCGELRQQEQEALREHCPCERCHGDGEITIGPDGYRTERCPACQGSGIDPDWRAQVAS